MIRTIVSLQQDATARQALELMLDRHLLALPLVDDDGRFSGTVDVTLFTDSLHDLTERQTSQDVFQMIGVHLTRGATSWRAFADRFPWLLSNIAGGLVAAFLASLFEPLLDAVIVLALFIPVVLALAESVSIQSVGLTLQSLHGARIDWPFLGGALRSEFGVALMLGLAAGAVVAFVAWVWKSNVLVALSIGGSIALSMLTACLLGVLLPVILRWLDRDPKVAAGPVVLALADTATLLFYFTLSGALLMR
jgi:magnesium transporter